MSPGHVPGIAFVIGMEEFFFGGVFSLFFPSFFAIPEESLEAGTG